MAAIYFKPTASNRTIFKSGFAANNSVYIPFLQNMIGSQGSLVVSEVTMQHHDTVQYFLTFDDFITYYYFGKGLGALSISGMIFSDCDGQFNSLNTLINQLSSIRGSVQAISFGNVAFNCVLNSFTIKASADPQSLHAIDFMVQMEIINSSMPPAVFTSSC